MKKLLSLFLICLSLFCLFSCGEDNNKDINAGKDDNSDAYADYTFNENYEYDGHSLVGKWQEKNYAAHSFVSYEFFENGDFEQVSYQYGIEFDRSKGTYTVEKNKFIVAFKNYDGTTEYVENKFNITDKGEILMLYLDLSNQMVEKKMVLVPFNIKLSEGTGAVLGTWEDKAHEGEFWKFNDDLTGIIYGNGYTYNFHYTIHNGKLYIANELIPGVMNDLVEYTFTVKDNVLTISAKINGTNISLSFNRR